MSRLPLLVVQNLVRNMPRTMLTMLGTMVLVMVVTLIWSILAYLDQATAEKSANLKVIITEKWRLPSQMPQAYAAPLKQAGARKPGDFRPAEADTMTWSFFGGSLDPEKWTRENAVFAFCMEPDRLLTMMDELEGTSLPPDKRAELENNVKKLQRNRQGIIVGRERLKSIGKRVGDRVVLHGINYKDISLEVEIVGLFPEGRYDNSAAMNIEYLLAALDAYKRDHRNTPHALADKSLNLVWLRVPDMDAFQQAATQITSSRAFGNPAVKVETQASGIAAFLDAYRDLLWGLRFLLAPAILATLALVISNAISISVRERQREFAVMKVLGFRPNQLLTLVLGESILLGVTAGLVSAALTSYVVNDVYGGLKFPIAFFPAFFIPLDALWWGPAIGVGASFAGSFLPAWSARSVRVSEVFARVA